MSLRGHFIFSPALPVRYALTLYRLLFPAMSDNPFKLIQITDCHFTAKPELPLKGVPPVRSLERVCEAIRRRHTNAEALIMTGDISEDGSIASYRRLLDIVGTIPMDIFALAGNHDDAGNLRKVLGPKINTGKLLNNDRWHILLLNSAIASKVAGSLSREELDWLRRQLDTRSDGYYMIALHHQPVPTGSEWMNHIALNNADELRTSIEDNPRVRLLIHGHTHQSGCYYWRHIPCYGTPSTWRQFRSGSRSHRMDFLPPAYRVIELFGDGSHRSWVEFV